MDMPKGEGQKIRKMWKIKSWIFIMKSKFTIWDKIRRSKIFSNIPDKDIFETLKNKKQKQSFFLKFEMSSSLGPNHLNWN